MTVTGWPFGGDAFWDDVVDALSHVRSELSQRNKMTPERLRAERLLGQVLIAAEVEEEAVGRPRKDGTRHVLLDRVKRLGFTADERKVWRQVARVPEIVFESEMARMTDRAADAARRG